MDDERLVLRGIFEGVPFSIRKADRRATADDGEDIVTQFAATTLHPLPGGVVAYRPGLRLRLPGPRRVADGPYPPSLVGLDPRRAPRRPGPSRQPLRGVRARGGDPRPRGQPAAAGRADRVLVPLPPGMPPGEYDVSFGVFDRASGERWAVASGEAEDGSRVPLGRLRVRPFRPLRDQLIRPTDPAEPRHRLAP